jgi:hypothetical protein
MIQKLLMSLVIFVLAFFGLSAVTKDDNQCINVYVDYGVLNNETKLTNCINSSTKMIALDVLRKSNLEIEGTKKYGMAVVCRVNGLPTATVESCDSMPPENAYWAIIIKEKQTLPFPRNVWGWGQLGVDQQYLNPGDSIGLVWANDGKVIFP